MDIVFFLIGVVFMAYLIYRVVRWVLFGRLPWPLQ